MAKNNDLMWIETTAVQLQQAKDRLAKQVEVFLSNKENSLDERWDVWTKYADKKHETSYHEFPEDRFPGMTDKFVGADGCWPSKYQTVHYTSMIDWASEQYDNIDDLKEYLMEQNLGSAEVDW